MPRTLAALQKHHTLHLPADEWLYAHCLGVLHRFLRVMLPTGSALSRLQSRYALKPKNPV